MKYNDKYAPSFFQEKTKFHFLTSPSLSELNSLLKIISQRIVKLLEKRGLIIKDEGVGDKFLEVEKKRFLAL